MSTQKISSETDHTFFYINKSSTHGELILAVSVQIYLAFKKDLESAIKSETSGEFRDLLVDLISGKKDKNSKVDQRKAENDAKALYEVLLYLFHKFSITTNFFHSILCTISKYNSKLYTYIYIYYK